MSPCPRGRPGNLRFGLLYGLLISGLLSGCAALPQQEPTNTNVREIHRPEIPAQSHWTATGRLSLVTEDEAWNAHLVWQQQDGNYRIRLSAPMGQGSLELLGSPARVILRNTGQPPVQAKNAEALLHQQTGWRLPLSGLRYWLLGSTAPDGDVSELKLNAAGQPSSLIQHGWHIDYRGYTQVSGRLYLPRKLFLHNGPLSARIVIRQWELEP